MAFLELTTSWKLLLQRNETLYILGIGAYTNDLIFFNIQCCRFPNTYWKLFDYVVFKFVNVLTWHGTFVLYAFKIHGCYLILFHSSLFLLTLSNSVYPNSSTCDPHVTNDFLVTLYCRCLVILQIICSLSPCTIERV